MCACLCAHSRFWKRRRRQRGASCNLFFLSLSPFLKANGSDKKKRTRQIIENSESTARLRLSFEQGSRQLTQTRIYSHRCFLGNKGRYCQSCTRRWNFSTIGLNSSTCRTFIRRIHTLVRWLQTTLQFNHDGYTSIHRIQTVYRTLVVLVSLDEREHPWSPPVSE